MCLVGLKGLLGRPAELEGRLPTGVLDCCGLCTDDTTLMFDDVDTVFFDFDDIVEYFTIPSFGDRINKYELALYSTNDERNDKKMRNAPAPTANRTTRKPSLHIT